MSEPIVSEMAFKLFLKSLVLTLIECIRVLYV